MIDDSLLDLSLVGLVGSVDEVRRLLLVVRELGFHLVSRRVTVEWFQAEKVQQVRVLETLPLDPDADAGMFRL